MPATYRWGPWLLAISWLALLALIPWWLGLPLLLSLTSILLLGVHGQPPQSHLLRAALRWGLPGVLLALAFALGGDGLAWAIALLGALAGFTLIAALEAWLDRELKRPAPAADAGASAPADASNASWPELARVSRAPPVVIIELAPPRWHAARSALRDLDGLPVVFEAGPQDTGTYAFADGHRIDGASARACFSPGGRWFATSSERGTMLWDRRDDCQHRLRRWQLSGWRDDQPWLQRHEAAMPVSLAHALGERER